MNAPVVYFSTFYMLLGKYLAVNVCIALNCMCMYCMYVCMYALGVGALEGSGSTAATDRSPPPRKNRRRAGGEERRGKVRVMLVRGRLP